MTRRLTREDKELWEALRRSVQPLRPLPEPVRSQPEPAARAVDAGADAAVAAPALLVEAKAPARPAAPPPLARLEERVRRRLARGRIDVDQRIDLHGMRQERAFAALVAFLRQSQAHGARIVLVITGKGRQSPDGLSGPRLPGDGLSAGAQSADEPGRGVLRQLVPVWLARPDLRDVVAGLQEAGRPHGGAGALYVRLRRRRGSRAADGEDAR